MKVADALAEFVAMAGPGRTLDAVIGPALADCFGCILAGAQTEVAGRAQTALGPLAAGEAPLYGTAATLSAPHAALVNAVAGHALELDDWEEPGNTHPSVVLLPALLAAAQQHRVSGRRLLAAYAVGTEVIMRLGEAITLDHYSRGFHATATLGAVGAAAAVARLTGLDPGQAGHAMAIVASQAIGYTAQFGSNAKPLQAGFAARAGVEAAAFAAAGATGQAGALDGPRGFAGLLGQHSEDRLAALIPRLGQPWALAEYGLVLKPWPSCGYTHRLMTAALTLRDQLGGDTGQIRAIHTTQPDFHHAILPFNRPVTRDEALFSVPACVAQVLVSGTLTVTDCETGFWTAPEAARLIACTTVTARPARNPALNHDPGQPDVLALTLADGSKLTATCSYPLGAPQNPMGEAQLAAKFRAATGRDGAQFTRLLGWTDAPDIADFFAAAARHGQQP